MEPPKQAAWGVAPSSYTLGTLTLNSDCSTCGKAFSLDVQQPLAHAWIRDGSHVLLGKNISLLAVKQLDQQLCGQCVGDDLCHRLAPDDAEDCRLPFFHEGYCSWHVSALPRRVPGRSLFDKGDITAAVLENLLTHAPVRNLKVTFEVQVHLDGTTLPVEITMPEGELRESTGYEEDAGIITGRQLAFSQGGMVMTLALKPTGGLRSPITVRVVK